jgi:hypothetical protein
MPSSTFHHPAIPDDIQLPQEQDFDRWCAAIEIIRRLREAGIKCELNKTFALHHRPTEEIRYGVLTKEGRSFTIAIC